MSDNKKKSKINLAELDEKLILEEYRQRYEQYRMHNENRNKYIHFYFIFYFAFWGLVGFLTKPESICLWKKLLCIHSTEYLLALVFLAHAIFGSIFFLSIISFRQIQSCEAKTIHMIKGLSENSKLAKEKEIEYPWDREIPFNCSGITITSQTPLVLLILILNHLSFCLSFYFFNELYYFAANNPACYFFAIFWVVVVIFKYVWYPKTLSYNDISKKLEIDC
jgi:hypothetical protein